jgi:predicted DNA-binding WGR domain protein
MTYVIEDFLHCCEGKSDKVWGFATVQGDEVYSFWGRRGSKLAFKRFRGNTHGVRSELYDKADQKRRKGYRAAPASMAEAIWPGFGKAFEDALFLAKMSENFRHDELGETDGV